MQNPDPPVGWTPTVSTLAGAGIGGSVAVVIIYVTRYFLRLPEFPAELVVAITAISNFLCGYVFKDGGRK